MASCYKFYCRIEGNGPSRSFSTLPRILRHQKSMIKLIGKAYFFHYYNAVIDAPESLDSLDKIIDISKTLKCISSTPVIIRTIIKDNPVYYRDTKRKKIYYSQRSFWSMMIWSYWLIYWIWITKWFFISMNQILLVYTMRKIRIFWLRRSYLELLSA